MISDEVIKSLEAKIKTPAKFIFTAQARLEALMRAYSEDRCCAGWLRELEFELWNEIHDLTLHEDLTGNYFLCRDDRALLEIARTANEAGGWIVWDKELGDRKFVTFEEWEVIRAGHKSRY